VKADSFSLTQNRKERACKPSSVSRHKGRAAAIYLDQPLPAGSPDSSGSDLPAVIARAGQQHAWSCRRWGLPCRRRHRRRGALLPHHFTFACAPKIRGHRLCVFCGTFPRVARAPFCTIPQNENRPRVAVSHHRALSCSDFPPALFRAGDRPTHSFQLINDYLRQVAFLLWTTAHHSISSLSFPLLNV
jgi:hypothetical protein